MKTKRKVRLLVTLVGLQCIPLFAQMQNGMTLQQCIETALEKSEQVRLEKEKLVEATAGVKEAKTGFLPKFSASLSATKLDEPPSMDFSSMTEDLPPGMDAMFGGGGKIYIGDDQLYNVIFSVQQPIFTGFKILNGYRAAQNGLKAVEENEIKVKRDLVLSVKKSFYGVLQLQRSVGVIDTSIRQLDGIVHDLENMMAQGMLGEQEVMKARVQKYNLELTRVKTRHGITMAKAALCNTMGIPIDSEIALVYEAVPPEKIDLPEMAVLIETARKSQSEIKALECQRNVLENMVKINRAAYMPNIVAQGNYNIKRPNRSYEPEFYNSWDITLALQMNLFDWGEGRHKTTKARSRLHQLEIGIEQAKNGIALGVEKSYHDVTEAFEKIGIAEKALEQARKSYRIISDQMAFGAAKNTDLLEAQRTLTEATINYHNGVINYYLKRSELEHLLEDNR
jgi:outer membrane protein